MPLSDTVRVRTDQLPVGSRLSHPINDGEDRLLLASGVLLTKRLKERLLARGIHHGFGQLTRPLTAFAPVT